jgi:hypothetical protein
MYVAIISKSTIRVQTHIGRAVSHFDDGSKTYNKLCYRLGLKRTRGLERAPLCAESGQERQHDSHLGGKRAIRGS